MCGSAVKTYAQADLTPEETQRIEEFVETKTEENGDTVHVYKKAVAPEPVQEQELPKQGETNKTTETQSTTVVKDGRVIETGVRTNLFVNLAMVVFSGIGLLTLALKKKEKE